MKVRCIANTGRGLPPQILNPENGLEITTQFGLTVGKMYTVYGLSVHDGFVDYLVLEEDRYPISYPAPLFEILDGRPSRYWVFHFGEVRWKYKGEKEHVEYDQSFHFSEFRDEGFYERLFDDSPAETAIFQKYKKLMDEEFPEPPDPSITESAVQIEDGWLQCPSCSDAWKSDSGHGMVSCPSCGANLRNPNYRN